MSRGRVGGRFGARDTSLPKRSGANGVWGLQEANDALLRSSWPTVLAPETTGFGIGQNPSDVNASCTFSATFTANAYRTGRWEDPITVSWQKADKNSDTPITGNPWIADDPQTGWGDPQYANAPAPVPYLKQVTTAVPTNSSGDPYFKNVALLMTMDTGFVDLSVNARALQATSGANIRTNFKKYGAASAEFNGSTGVVTTATNNNMALSDAPFTIEAWVYMRSDTMSGCIISEQHAGTPISIAFGFHGPNGFEDLGRRLFFASYNGSWWHIHITAGTDLPLNQWVHVAVVREGNFFYLFYDGVVVGFGVTGSSINSPTLNFNVGKRWDNAGSNPYFDGYIDDLRLTIGVARYPASFSPPTAAFPTSNLDPAFNQVALLVPMTGSNNSLTFTDVSPAPNTLVRGGNLKVTTTVLPDGSNGGAGTFDGTDDALTVSSGSNFTFNGDFTIEGWFKFSNNSKGYQALVMTHSNSDVTGWILLLESNNRLYFYSPMSYWWGGNYWAMGADTGITPPLNTWVHIAVTRSGAVFQIFFNGQVVYGTTYTNPVTAGNTLEIGDYAGVWGATSRGFEGQMAQVRITNGVCRYTANFTPPTLGAQLTWADPDALASAVALFTNFETGSSDISNNRFYGVINGPGGLTSANKKYGTYSLSNASVNFSGDITLPSSFTVEAWFYFNATTTKRYLFSSGTLGVNLTDLYLENSKLYLQINGGSPQTLTGAQHVSAQTWTHIALVRNVASSSSVIRCYVNGLSIGDFTYSGQVGDTTTERTTTIFAAANDYTDELRITRAARYTANFTPPSALNNGTNLYALQVTAAGKRAINGTYYPSVSSNNAYNGKQFYRKADNMYCLFWYDGYWIIHEADGAGNPAGSWQYYNDGYNWKTIQTYPLQFAQPLSVTLALTNLTFADNATYYRIEAKSGFQTAVSDAALLTVEPLSISFTTEPQDTVIDSSVTGSVTFTASATGIGRTTGQTYSSFTYQWQKKGLDGGWQDIPFATGASVTDTALTPGADNGNQYRVRAGCGTTNIGYSRAALLTII